MPNSISPPTPVQEGQAVLGIGSFASPARKRARRQKDSRRPVTEQLDIAAFRTRMYLLISLGYRYPSRDTIAAMKEEIEALRRLARRADTTSSLADGWPKDAIERARTALSGLRFEAIEAEYLRVFTHVITSDCHPCETAYTATHMFQQAQKIADLNGFYRAFGVEPDVERPDHVSVESEFMAFLIQKEANALSNGRPRRAGFVRRTQRTFIEDHLGPWVRTFARFVEIKAEEGPYAALAALTKRLFESEFEELSAEVRELTGPPKPLPLLMAKEQEDEDDDCPAFATAEPRGVVLRPPTLDLNPEVMS